MNYIEFQLFKRKIIKTVFYNKSAKELNVYDVIVMKIFLIIADLKSNKHCQCLNKNNVTLYETCFLIFYIIRLSYFFSDVWIKRTLREEFDDYIIPLLVFGYEELFDCTLNSGGSIGLERIYYYDEILSDYEYKHDKKDIKCILEEFIKIITLEMQTNEYEHFNSNMPVPIPNSLEDMVFLQEEAKYPVHMATNSFTAEINKLIGKK